MEAEYRVMAVVVAVRDGKATIIDREGVAITTVELDHISGIASMADAKWGAWAGQAKDNWASALGVAKIRDGEQGAWNKRIEGMRWAWKNRTRSFRGQDSDRTVWVGRKPGNAPTWDECSTYLMETMSRRRDTLRRQSENPWNRWAEYTSRNTNKRYAERYAKSRNDHPKANPRPA